MYSKIRSKFTLDFAWKLIYRVAPAGSAARAQSLTCRQPACSLQLFEEDNKEAAYTKCGIIE